MRAEAVFVPVAVLALWTGVVLLIVGGSRIQAVRAGRVTANAFSFGESPEVPPEVSLVNRNLMNLLEMPMLFYVACIAFYATGHVDRGVLALAWLFVALRLVHSMIHLTWNHILSRLAVFGLSNFVLLAIWILFLARVA